MDTSKKYIKICDCPEIQDGWEPERGDWTDKGLVTSSQHPYIKDHVYADDGWDHISKIIYLPRQDQLQGMLNGLQTIPPSMFQAFVEWAQDPWGYGSMPFPRQGKKILWWQDEYIPQFETVEQFLLAYIMWELHGKKWDGNSWVLTDTA